MGAPPVKRMNLRGRVAQRDGGVCVDCPPGTPPWPWEQWHVDHVIELADGGDDDLSNVVTRCVPHHREKTRRSVWARSVARSNAVSRGPSPRRSRGSDENATYMGAYEVGVYLNVSRQRVDQLARLPDFPEPVAVLYKNRRIWLRADIEKWARDTGRSTP